MVRVAVAGGTGGLGRTLVESIANTNLHHVFVLTRSPTGIIAGRRGIQALVVDYSSPTAIAEVLRSESIDTVVSAIGIVSEDAHQAQLNLIEGAAQSGTVRRFAPSEFGWDYEEELKKGYPPAVPGLGEYRAAAYKTEAVRRLRAHANLAFTRYVAGFLMDYYGHPHETVNVLPLTAVLDMESAKAAIPGDGNAKVVLTHSRDIADFVALSLSLRDWPETCYIVGDRLTWNEALVYAEQARGYMFEMTYDPVDMLRQARVTELPANIPRYAYVRPHLLNGLLSVWGIGFAEGRFDLPGDTLEELFPDARPVKFQELVSRCWKGRAERR